jgi:hypothetical protein
LFSILTNTKAEEVRTISLIIAVNSARRRRRRMINIYKKPREKEVCFLSSLGRKEIRTTKTREEEGEVEKERKKKDSQVGKYHKIFFVCQVMENKYLFTYLKLKQETQKKNIKYLQLYSNRKGKGEERSVVYICFKFSFRGLCLGVFILRIKPRRAENQGKAYFYNFCLFL